MQYEGLKNNCEIPKTCFFKHNLQSNLCLELYVCLAMGGRPLHKIRVPSLPCLAIARTKQVCLALPCDCPDTGAQSCRAMSALFMSQHCIAFPQQLGPCESLAMPCLALPCEGLSEGSLAFPSICTALPCKAGAQL